MDHVWRLWPGILDADAQAGKFRVPLCWMIDFMPLWVPALPLSLHPDIAERQIDVIIDHQHPGKSKANIFRNFCTTCPDSFM